MFHSSFTTLIFLKIKNKRKAKKVVGLLFHGGALLFGNLINTACWYKKLLPVLNKGLLIKEQIRREEEFFLFILIINIILGHVV